MKNWWGLLFICASFSACFQPKEACLEIEAVNFDPTADQNCCCTYPQLKLDISHIYDTVGLVEGAAYPTASGQMFRILDVAFYLSSFELFQQNNRFSVVDSTILYRLGDAPTDTVSAYYREDVLLVRREDATTHAAGSFATVGSFDNFCMHFGLSDALNKTLPGKAPTGHPLARQSEGLHTGNTETGYYFARIILTRDSLTSTVPDTLFIMRAEMADTAICFPNTYVHEPGKDFYVDCIVDYKKWFGNIDFLNLSIADIKEKIIENIPSGFEILPK